MLNMCPAAGSPTGFSLRPETKKKLSDINIGKKLSEETKRKISQTLSGIKKTPEHIANATLARKGYKATEETKKKLSVQRLSTNPDSANWREKLKAAWVIRKQRNHA